MSERRIQFGDLGNKGPEERQKIIAAMNADRLLIEERLFIGKNYSKAVGLFIHGQQRNSRFKTIYR